MTLLFSLAVVASVFVLYHGVKPYHVSHNRGYGDAMWAAFGITSIWAVPSGLLYGLAGVEIATLVNLAGPLYLLLVGFLFKDRLCEIGNNVRLKLKPKEVDYDKLLKEAESVMETPVGKI